jgi:hypothetical protein
VTGTRTFALLALGWNATWAAIYGIGFMLDTSEWAIFAVALVIAGAALLGVLGTYSSKLLTWLAALLLIPSCGIIIYAPAALAMLVAAVSLQFTRRTAVA